MQNSIFLFILMAFLTIRCFSQTDVTFNVPFTSLEFENNPPLWHYSVKDPTIIGEKLMKNNRMANGYNSLLSHLNSHDQTLAIEGDELYISELSKGTNSYLQGALIQKINITTGVVMWSNTFDNRRGDDHQDYLSTMHLTSNSDTLIITSARNIKKWSELPTFQNLTYVRQGSESTMAIRKYDTKTGLEYNHTYANPSDTSKLRIRINAFNNPSLHILEDNTYQYIWADSYRKKKIQISNINEKFETTNFFQDSIKYNGFSNTISTIIKYIIFKTNDTIFHLDLILDDNNNRKPAAFLTLYDNELNKLNRITLDEITSRIEEFKNTFDDLIDFRIKSIGGNILHLVVIANDKSRNTILYDIFITKDGNITYLHNSNMLPGIDKDYGHVNIKHLPMTNKLIALGMKGNIKDRANNGVLDFYIYDNGTWVEKHNITFGQNYCYKNSPVIQQLDNGDLLIKSSMTKYDPALDSFSFTHSTWMRVDGEKLGLKVATDHVAKDKNLFKITPNPASDQITALFDQNISGTLDLIDEQGKVITTQEINNQKEVELHVKHLTRGLYYARFTNSDNKTITQKVLLQ